MNGMMMYKHGFLTSIEKRSISNNFNFWCRWRKNVELINWLYNHADLIGEPHIEEAAGTYYGRDDYFIENRPFTSEETIGDYQGNHPYTGIEIKSISVTYSCSY